MLRITVWCQNVDADSEYSVALNTTVRFTKSTVKDEVKVVLSRDDDAIKVNLTDTEIRDRYPFDYATLTEKCKKRYSDFVINAQYHKNRKQYENDTKYAYIRYLDPKNPTGGEERCFIIRVCFPNRISIIRENQVQESIVRVLKVVDLCYCENTIIEYVKLLPLNKWRYT